MSSSRFKGFFLGCFLVCSSLIRKKKLTKTTPHCHSLSLVVPFVLTRSTTCYHLLSFVVVIHCHLMFHLLSFYKRLTHYGIYMTSYKCGYRLFIWLHISAVIDCFKISQEIESSTFGENTRKWTLIY